METPEINDALNWLEIVQKVSINSRPPYKEEADLLDERFWDLLSDAMAYTAETQEESASD